MVWRESGRHRRRLRRRGRPRFFGACFLGFLLWRLSAHGEIPNDPGGQALLPLGIKLGDLEAHEFPAILSGLAIQNELRDVGQGDRIFPGNAFDGDQFKEIAKEAIDRGRIGEIRHRGEELGGGGLRGTVTPKETLGVMGAEFSRLVLKRVQGVAGGNVRRGDEHTAAAAEGVDMSAAEGVVVVDLGERAESRVWQGKCAGHPLPPGFYARV
jgi:hypothetical protein